jgi:hypothetical protein
VHATGHFTIGRTVLAGEAGAYALVEVLGQLCVSGSPCVTNSNPSAGLPAGSETASQAFSDDLVTGNYFAPTPCAADSRGNWYVTLNGSA